MRVDESNREALAREGNVRRQFQADMKKGHYSLSVGGA
jgi:hypothetical protein